MGSIIHKPEITIVLKILASSLLDWHPELATNGCRQMRTSTFSLYSLNVLDICGQCKKDKCCETTRLGEYSKMTNSSKLSEPEAIFRIDPA